jgi:tRNA(Ile2) C34 agmatinyltransferase TiaS
MTPAVLDRPASRFAERPGAGPAAGADRLGGGRVTLEERLNGALHEVRTNGSTECPVCQARMTLTSAGADPGAACGGCGAELG